MFALLPFENSSLHGSNFCQLVLSEPSSKLSLIPSIFRIWHWFPFILMYVLQQRFWLISSEFTQILDDFNHIKGDNKFVLELKYNCFYSFFEIHFLTNITVAIYLMHYSILATQMESHQSSCFQHLTCPITIWQCIIQCFFKCYLLTNTITTTTICNCNPISSTPYHSWSSKKVYLCLLVFRYVIWNLFPVCATARLLNRSNKFLDFTQCSTDFYSVCV